ncbi:hypothetical protein IZ6_17160 [Terrihabitans soli]|uniref:HdeD family acid-resistance protein n=1 Tax=Terrihabitans soli TaxID=708113 RepID=A0A6S6QV60_9HYPH|nr:HdeD family acid-resistance protein [Terrihabitans soli]BCJ90981.1 hypothetical protein IZ6_17160 [Terrihabitans soli]
MTAPVYSPAPSVSQSVRANWGWFLILGIALTIAGAFAILLPVYSTLATSLFLGVILIVAGIFQIFHAFRVKTWHGFFWDLAIGIVQIVGGAIIYMNPFAGAITITALIAGVFLAQGVTQLLLAFKVRPHDGWVWLLSSGLLALIIAFMLFARFPASSLTTPGVLAGISILFSGLSYIMIALAARKKAA